MLIAYWRMLPRLQAEEQRAQVNVLLAAGGQAMRDTDRTSFLGELDRAAAGGVRERAPRITLDVLRRMGATIAPPDDAPTEGG